MYNLTTFNDIFITTLLTFSEYWDTIMIWESGSTTFWLNYSSIITLRTKENNPYLFMQTYFTEYMHVHDKSI